MEEGSDDIFGANEGKARVSTRNTIDHFAGLAIGEIDTEVVRSGLHHVGCSKAEQDHFAGQMMTMGEDAGDGFGGMLDGAHRGEVQGHTNHTSDHFTGMALNASAGDTDNLMSAGGIMCMGGIGKDSSQMGNEGKGKTGDHFVGGSMGMAYGGEGLVDSHGVTIASNHQHKAGEKQASTDHFQGGSMSIEEGAGSSCLLSVTGTMMQSLKASGEHHKSQDHFEAQGFALDESADSGILSVSGAMVNHRRHVDGLEGMDEKDHFEGGTMIMKTGGGEDGIERLISSDGSVLRGVSHKSDHGTNEHSFDHFQGMSMDESVEDIGLLGVSGAMSKGVAQVKGSKASDDHFTGMGLNESAGTVLTDAMGNKLQGTHHIQGVGKSDDHFSGSSVGAGHGKMSQADSKLLDRNKHFSSFYT